MKREEWLRVLANNKHWRFKCFGCTVSGEGVMFRAAATAPRLSFASVFPVDHRDNLEWDFL